MAVRVGVGVVAAACLASSVAWAQAPGMTAPLEQPGGSQVDGVEVVPAYRAQTLAADGLAVVFAIAAGKNQGHASDTLAKLALATYVLGAPAVHLAHHRATHSLASVGLRVALPITAAYLGRALARSQPSGCSPGDDLCDTDGGLGGALLGLGLGMVSAVIIDSAVFARSEVVHHAPRLVPAIAPTPGGGMSFGVGGSF